MIQTDLSGGADAPPEAVLSQMLFGALMQQSVCVAARLGIADLLAKEPQTASELSAATGTDEPSLYRLLRTLASAGIFAENAARQFDLTPLASLLRSDAPNSMRDFAVMMGERWLWDNWGELMHCVKTGGTAQEKAHGMGSFEFFTRNAEAGRVFNRAMTNLSRSVVPALVQGYDFSQIDRLVDVAGGHGLLLAGILNANPRMHGVLFDLPPVIGGAGDLLESESVLDRVELVPGDFFQSVPAGADAYVMKHIIHDWDDECSTKILRNIRAAMNDGGRVLIVEMVVPDGNDPSPSKIMDIQMLVMEGGRERTEIEYRKLLEASGFRLTRTVPTRSPFSVIEGHCL